VRLRFNHHSNAAVHKSRILTKSLLAENLEVLRETPREHVFIDRGGEGRFHRAALSGVQG
jgi:hypothetical protein